MKITKRIAAVLMSAVLITPAVFAEEELSSEYTYVDKMFGYASEMYVDEGLTKEEILNRALNKYLEENPDAVLDILKAGFSEIDDYTEFYTSDDYQQYVDSINHTFCGIGVIIQKNGSYVEIVRVLDGGDAKNVGMEIGDQISKVDGVDMKDKTVDEVQAAVIGEENTSVIVTVLRNGAELTFNLTRKMVNATTVDYRILENNIAYVSILNFAQTTSQEFANVLEELDKNNVTDIILDLRDNPGGYLISAVEIANLIVPEGIIVQTMYRQSENNITYYSHLKNPKYKFAVLVNENTASAAEILTGAMQDSGVAEVIGETTYGKAVIQEIYNMRDGNAFKITTGRYLTRNGREINHKGIEPDRSVSNTTEPIDVSKYKEINYSEETRYGDTSENIVPIKERLSVMGYGMKDFQGIFDSELEAAVLDFQISKGIAPTGALDRITMVQIENAFAKTEVVVDNQLYEAYEYFGGTREELKKILEEKE